MDWSAVASILGERSDRPLILLDQTGQIRMFNHVIERLLGWRRFEVEGHAWAHTCTPPEHRQQAESWIGDALRGALASVEAHAVTKTNDPISFRFELSLVGSGSSQGLLLTATQWKATAPSVQIGPCSDLDYDIATDPGSFGTLARLVVDAEPVRLPADAPRCYAAIHAHTRPCADCPALRTDDAPWPRVSVAPSAGAFVIKSAERISSGLVRIRTRTVSDHTLEAIHTAKIDHLSDGADLSAREREILTHLLLGRTIDDIAVVLGIAIRTVKFHQANVLQKLGADSRADLMRLLF